MQTFFHDADYRAYLDLLVEHRAVARVDLWAYCLMPNHVHLVCVPTHEDSLARLFRQVHQRYARRVNKRQECTGHLWQERFQSFVMDESHLYSAVRYVELNPVRAGLCESPEQWVWSSVHAHLGSAVDELVSVNPMWQRVSDWRSFLSQQMTPIELKRIRSHATTGRPAGSNLFLHKIQALTGQDWHRKKPGPKRSNT